MGRRTRRKPQRNDKDAWRYTAPHGVLTFFLRLLGDPRTLRYILILFTAIVFLFYAIIYPWIQVPLENPGAKIGLGVGMLLLLLVALLQGARISDLPVWMFVLLCLVCSFAGSFIGSGIYDWNEDLRSIEQRRQSIFESQFKLLQLYRDFIFNFMAENSPFVAPANAAGNVSLKTEQNE
jgi:hypothetical protein